MAVLSADAVLGLGSKYSAEMVYAQEAQNSPAFATVSRVDKDDVQGVASIIDESDGSTEYLAAGGALPTGGSVSPGQTQYGPKTILDRLVVPLGIVIGNSNLAQGVNNFRANLDNCASRIARDRAYGFFTKKAYTLVAAVTTGDLTFEVKNKSWARTNKKYDIYNGTTFVETVTVASYDYSADGSGNYTITLAAVTTADWSIGYDIYPKGAYAYGFDSFEDVAGSATFQGVNPSTFKNWKGINNNQGGALTTVGMRNIEDDTFDISGMRPTHWFLNTFDLSTYLELFQSNMRWKPKDKLDNYDFVPTFNGKPVIAGPEVPKGVVHGYHSEMLKFHEFKAPGPYTAGSLPTGGMALDQRGLIPHPTQHAMEMRIFAEQNIRVHCRNANPRLYGVTP